MSALLSSSAAQPAELSLLMDLEARWENLRGNRIGNAGKEDTAHLQQKQRAYEAFHDKLTAYNKTFKPEHVPERLLNTAVRLGEWCRKMRDVLARLEQVPKVPYPGHLMEKAYRSADHVADRMQKERAVRPAPSGDVAGAVRELESLARWCEESSPVQ